MKNEFKKYYEMSKDTKEMLANLYMIHELECLLPEYENINISSMKDEETIIKVAIECWYYSNIDGGEIVRRILDILSCRDITVEDLSKIDTEYLIYLITEDETDFKEDPNKTIILSEFIYRNYKCAFFRDGTRLVLTFEKNNHVEVCIYNTFEEILCFIIENRLNSQKETVEY